MGLWDGIRYHFPMYDASKETDKDFLRAALKRVQEENIAMAKEIALLKKQKIKDEDICKKFTEELFLLRKSIYGSKKEASSLWCLQGGRHPGQWERGRILWVS